MYSKDFDRLSVEDKARWLVGEMLCSELEEDPPGLVVGSKSIVLVKTGDLYAVIYQDEDVFDTHELEKIGFKDLKEFYNYLLENCNEWYIED